MFVSCRNILRSTQVKMLAAGVLAALVMPICSVEAQQSGSIGDQPALNVPQGPELNSQASYIIGRQIITDFAQDDVEIDLKALIQGIQDAAAGKESAMSPEETQATMVAFSRMVTAQKQAKLQKLADDNLAEGQQFLKENQLKPGIKQLESGVQYEVLKEGTGESPEPTDVVTVHYTGTFLDGTKFDSSVDRGEPAVFPLNRVISGWTTTVPRMKVGSKWKLFIPSDLAYGERGNQGIPPNKTLVFEIELLKIGE